MNDLKMLAVIIGAVTAGLSLPCLLFPKGMMRLIVAFPRSKVAAWILTAICTVWVTKLLFETPLSFFDNYKPALYVIAPLFFVLTVSFMDELLASRALGGLMLLVPCIIIDIARQRGILLVSIAYVLVVTGIILVLSPYYFRKGMAFWVESNARCKVLGMLGTAAGIIVAVSGLLFY